MIRAYTFEEILSDMKTAFKEQSGFEADDASDIGIRLRLLAGQLFSQSSDISFVARQLFLQTATGEFLDKHAQLRGLSRRTATKAHGTARFLTTLPAESDIVIPQGTLCAISGENSQSYITKEQVILAQGEVQAEVEIEAVNSGEQGNAAVGSVTIILNPPQGISTVTNTTELSGGSMQESDELLRDRIFKSLSSISNGANLQFYKELAMQNPKVVSASAIPLARGAGTVDVVFETAETSESEITAIKNALDTVLANSREIGTDAKAFCCENQLIDITIYIKTKSSNVSDNVIAEIRSKVSEHISSLRVGENLIISRLCNIIYNTDGVYNLKIALPTDDTAISARSKLVIGTLTVSDVL